MTKKTPVAKRLAVILFSEKTILDNCLPELEQAFSPIDFHGKPVPFDHSSYYKKEMGENLLRMIISFEELADPADMVSAKRTTEAIESDFSLAGNRQINIDIGYIDLFKLVLASFKERGNKIYLGDGVWADMIAHYHQARFTPSPWCFPDFASGIYDSNLIAIRDIYKSQLPPR